MLERSHMSAHWPKSTATLHITDEQLHVVTDAVTRASFLESFVFTFWFQQPCDWMFQMNNVLLKNCDFWRNSTLCVCRRDGLATSAVHSLERGAGQ